MMIQDIQLIIRLFGGAVFLLGILWYPVAANPVHSMILAITGGVISMLAVYAWPEKKQTMGSK